MDADHTRHGFKPGLRMLHACKPGVSDRTCRVRRCDAERLGTDTRHGLACMRARCECPGLSGRFCVHGFTRYRSRHWYSIFVIASSVESWYQLGPGPRRQKVGLVQWRWCESRTNSWGLILGRQQTAHARVWRPRASKRCPSLVGTVHGTVVLRQRQLCGRYTCLESAPRHREVPK